MPSGSPAATATPVAEILARRIQEHGPITYAEWMSTALYHPVHGYYRRGQPTVGRDGDFLTSPEVHPLFGAAIAQVVSGASAALGQPTPLRIIELGPGTGALAESLLAALEPTLPTPIALTLIEADPVAADAQRRRLGRFGASVEWRDSIAGGERDAHVVIANELLDAQPVHRLRFGGCEWAELLVDWSAQAGFHDRAAPLSDPTLAEPLRQLSPRRGQTVEVSPRRAEIVAELSETLGDGLLLLFDYGYPRHELYAPHRLGGTLMTFRRHVPGEHPYAYAGEQDITCHIDIDQASAAFEDAGLTAWRPRSQAEWLQALSAELLPAAEAARRLVWRRALEALGDPDGLGRIAVLAATRGPINELPGLGTQPHS